MSMQDPGAQQATEDGGRQWPAILTWVGEDAQRMESVRVQILGQRIKASGRIISAATAERQAFSASYDLVTDEAGVTRRLSLRLALPAGERQMSISRDEEGTWMVEDGSGAHRRERFNGALDVDVTLSAFFSTLPIRRLTLGKSDDVKLDVQVPVVSVDLLTLGVEPAQLTYSSSAEGVDITANGQTASVAVDADGFVVDYPGFAKRV